MDSFRISCGILCVISERISENFPGGISEGFQEDISDRIAVAISKKLLVDISAGISERIVQKYPGGTLRRISEGIYVGFFKTCLHEYLNKNRWQKSLVETPQEIHEIPRTYLETFLKKSLKRSPIEPLYKP